MITADTQNAPDWVDLTTPNAQSAVAFYSQLLGWEMETTSTPMGDYHIAKEHGHEVAGLMEQGPELEGQPPVWTMYINVADVDETAGNVIAAGGAVLEPPFDIPDGRVAIAADPSGAMFGIIATPLEHSDQRWFSVSSGAVCWLELLTRDPSIAELFYSEVFSWKADTDDSTEPSYTIFRLDGDGVAGMMAMPDEVPAEAPSHWMVYFAVDDCEAAELTAIDLGGRVLRTTHEIDMGRFAVLEDREGAPFQIMEYRR